MPRSARVKLRISKVDSKYCNLLVAKLISTVMRRGKKALAERMVYDALDMVDKKHPGCALEVFLAAIDNVTPVLEVCSRVAGGATYQVPVEVRSERAVSLALRWLVRSARSVRSGGTNFTFSYCLFQEIMLAYVKKGGAYKICEERYKMAEASRAYSHIRF